MSVYEIVILISLYVYVFFFSEVRSQNEVVSPRSVDRVECGPAGHR